MGDQDQLEVPITVDVPGDRGTLTLSRVRAYEWATGIVKAADLAETTHRDATPEEQKTPPNVTLDIPAENRKFIFSLSEARELAAALTDAVGDIDPDAIALTDEDLAPVAGGAGGGYPGGPSVSGSPPGASSALSPYP